MGDGQSSDDYHRTCYDCERTAARPLGQVEVCMPIPCGGYDFVSVPMCKDCRGERYGYDCPQCGLEHASEDSAKYCCQRAPGEAPDCAECGRRMERTSFGYTADGRPTVEFAECEACGVGWGKFTGWHDLDAAEEST